MGKNRNLQGNGKKWGTGTSRSDVAHSREGGRRRMGVVRPSLPPPHHKTHSKKSELLAQFHIGKLSLFISKITRKKRKNSCQQPTEAFAP
jgi:hypothetical protein